MGRSMTNFTVGDEVRLKSGGPKMKVKQVIFDDVTRVQAYIQCAWSGAPINGVIFNEEETYEPNLLEIV